ncbi:MAG: hypothetical protein WD712_00245 [Candidatus Spechtbacterales bacterium]
MGFKINGKKPADDYIMHDGDVLEFIVVTIDDIRKDIQRDITDIIDAYHLNISFSQVADIVYKEKDQEDFNNLCTSFVSRANNIEEVNSILEIVNRVWNYFPHNSLSGLSPFEKMQQQKDK